MRYRMNCKNRICLLLCLCLLAASIPLSGIASTPNVKQSRRAAEISEFPESYRSGLERIRETIPNAQFIYYDTGLDWSKDLLSSENEMMLGRNLVPAGSISSWKSTSIYGSYNWPGDYYVAIEPGWNQASEEIVEYFMDPRNFLNVESIFQFEQLSFNESVHTLESVEQILSGTFMAADSGNRIDPNEDPGSEETAPSETETGDPEKSETEETKPEELLTYAEVFVQLGREFGVSPCLLATRVRQEQGITGDSELISGNYQGANGVYVGYYNYFNIDAYGGTRDEIVQGGLREAKNAGWNTRYKALAGGAEKLAKNYVAAGKDTLYLQHFNVVALGANNTVNYYPYMTNVLAPTNEARNVLKSYEQNGMLGKAFSFVIPVYRNMPSTPKSMPTKDGNPNNRLKGLSVNDYKVSIGTFDYDQLSYSALVDHDVDEVKISAAIFNTLGTIKIAGRAMQTGVSDVAAMVSLEVGSNTIPIEITAQNGDKRTYTIVVTRMEGEGETPTVPESKPSFTMSGVKLSDGILTGVQPGTTVQTVLSGFSGQHCSARITGASGSALDGSAAVGTGQVLTVVDETGNEIESHTIIIYGDCTGDGAVNVRDMAILKRHILKIETLTGTAFEAIDLDDSNALNVRDMALLKRHILGIQKVSQ